MPHKQKHRGSHAQDIELFNENTLPTLQEAVYDYSFLLTRGYSEDALFKLVGDRYQLQKRQRLAVMRSACSDISLNHRQQRIIDFHQINEPVLIDGFNLLITIESALSRGYIFEGRDGSYRDIASIHASYKRVEETFPALELIGNYLSAKSAEKVYWYLDKPVSNSGKLKQYIEEIAGQYHWPWEVTLKQSPDFALKEVSNPVVTTDGVILDHCHQWLNLGRWIIDELISTRRLFRLNHPSGSFST